MHATTWTIAEELHSVKKKSPKVIYCLTLLIQHSLNDKIMKLEKTLPMPRTKGGQAWEKSGHEYERAT